MSSCRPRFSRCRAASRCAAFQSMPPRAARLVAEHHVLADRQVRAEVDLLVDRRDAGPLGVGGAAEDPRLAGDGDRAAVDRVDAGERLDEGGLAGAVLAHERVDLAGAEEEVDAVEREDAGEADGDAAHLDDRGDFGVRRHGASLTFSLRSGTSAGGRCDRPPAESLTVLSGDCGWDQYRTRVDDLGRLLLREALVLDVVRLLDVLAGEHVLHEAGRQLTEERVALDDEVDLAVDERLHAVLDRVDRDDLDVLTRHAAGGLDRLDRTERHVVVVRVEQVDAVDAVLLEEALHDGLAAVTGEVTRLRVDRLDRGALDGLVEALGAVVGRGRAGRALEHDHLGRRCRRSSRRPTRRPSRPPS